VSTAIIHGIGPLLLTGSYLRQKTEENLGAAELEAERQASSVNELTRRVGFIIQMRIVIFTFVLRLRSCKAKLMRQSD
jgi:hypothetical protein